MRSYFVELDFVNNYWFINEYESDIIIYVIRLLLFSENVLWEKKIFNDWFDVIMGLFDGVEICELVGFYILLCFIEKYGNNIGFYCDDGLLVFNKMF